MTEVIPGMKALATTAPQKSPVVAGARGLNFHGGDIESMYRFCTAVVNSRQFKDIETPEIALIRLQAGLELGLTPIWSLTNIMVTNGRPSVWGDALLGIVRSRPECEDVIETLQGEGDKMEAVCEVRRKGQTPVVRRFSVADAKLAGLWDKKNRDGSPSVWMKYPKRMLQMRARGFACRDAFADALRGFGIIEELRDIEPTERPISAIVLPPMQLPGEPDDPLTEKGTEKHIAAAQEPPAAPKKRTKKEKEPEPAPAEPVHPPEGETQGDATKNEQGEYEWR